MKIASLTLVLALSLACMSSGSRQPQGLESLYQQIDEAIERAPQYVARREADIAKLKASYTRETDVDRKFLLAVELFEQYRSYMNDSALQYIGQSIALAERRGRPDLAGHGRARMAFQCSTVGMYTEAADLLALIDTAQLSARGLQAYYQARMHLYGEVASYSRLDDARQHYFHLKELYRDSLLASLDRASLDYALYHQEQLVDSQRLDEALRASDHWLNAVREGTHEGAIASYYRHIVYDKMGDRENTRRWLAKSALDDIRCAVMDQAALITLADLLRHDGQSERAYRYIRYTWDCNNHFNTRMRSWQISPVLTAIEHGYQDAQRRQVTVATVSVVVLLVAVLAALALFGYASRQRRRLAAAQAELKAANEELKALNFKLENTNEAVIRYNRELFAINHSLAQKG